VPADLEGLFRSCPEHGVEAAPPDLVIVSLQETCNLAYAYIPSFGSDSKAASDWTLALLSALNGAFSGGARTAEYVQLCSFSLIGMALVAYTRSTTQGKALLPSNGSIATCEARCGRFNAGNKGAVALSMEIERRRLCIACLHLHAGEQESDADLRAQDISELLKQLRFDHDGCVVNAFEHDLVIWAGDFNSRPNFRRQRPYSKEDSGRHAESSISWAEYCPPEQSDELSCLLSEGVGVWGLFEEMPTEFKPTYKLKPKQLVYDESKSHAWCDRIIWWARPDKFLVQPLSYRSVDEVRISDHKPVSLRLIVKPTGGDVQNVSSGSSSLPPVEFTATAR